MRAEMRIASAVFGLMRHEMLLAWPPTTRSSTATTWRSSCERSAVHPMQPNWDSRDVSRHRHVGKLEGNFDIGACDRVVPKLFGRGRLARAGDGESDVRVLGVGVRGKPVHEVVVRVEHVELKQLG